jgi:hypothetical protein
MSTTPSVAFPTYNRYLSIWSNYILLLYSLTNETQLHSRRNELPPHRRGYKITNSKSTPGSISESRNRRSAKGSTLRRWIAATTPAAVKPSSRNFCKARRIGWSFSWFSRVAPSASYCRRRSPLVEKTAEASRRRSGDKTTSSATPCLKIQGRQGCTTAHARTSAGGCSHRPAPPCGPSSHPSTRRRTPRKRDGSTGPSEGQSPKTPRKPP